MQYTGTKYWIWWAALGAMVLAAGCGADDSGCDKDADCASGQVCVSGECRDKVVWNGTDTPGGGASGSASDSGEPASDSATQAPSDTGAAATDSGTAAGTEPCTGDPFVDNGGACDNDCQCFSGHCNNGYCCDQGECCARSEDCGNDLCATPVCADAMCAYSTTAFACGATDGAGWQQCADGEVCDGQGGCLPVDADCGYYAAKDGAFDCTGAVAEVVCYTSCTPDNAATHCASNARCVDGRCVDENAQPDGASCTADGQCLSGHCEGGICCGAGECCTTVADCDDTCRTNVACGANHQCVSAPLACGAEDAAGSGLCQGDFRCDGAGGCVDVETCAEQGSPFASDGTYTCADGAVIAGCRDRCTSHGDCASPAVCDFSDNTCKLPNGTACTQDAQCQSGHCDNGYCCQSGTCCATSADCDTPCSTGNTCLAGVKSCAMDGDFAACGAQTAACAGSNRCDGYGQCVAVSGTCSGATFQCAPGTVTAQCTCTTDADCDDNDQFCDGTYLCRGGVCDFSTKVEVCAGTPCNPRTCNEATDTCEDGPDPCAGQATACDPKQCVVTSATTYRCDPAPVVDGTPCDDGDACNGVADRCDGGQCVPGPLNTAACFDGDPCTEDACVDNGDGTADCTYTPLAVGDPCTAEFSCFGSGATCQLGQGGTGIACVASASVCDTAGWSVCRRYTCTENFYDTGDPFTCADEANTDYVELRCGETVTLTPADFSTRNNYAYGGVCADAAPFWGMEARLSLRPGTEDVLDAQLQVVAVSPSTYGALEFLVLDNVCDVDSCTARGTGGLGGISLLADKASVQVVVDSIAEPWPPDSVMLQLVCP